MRSQVRPDKKQDDAQQADSSPLTKQGAYQNP